MAKSQADGERFRRKTTAGRALARARGGSIWLLLALTLGLLRFVQLGEWSLWYDEAITWADAHHAVDDGGLYNPFGYVLIRWSAGLMGRGDEFALRWLPAFAGWLAIGLTYWAFAPFAGKRRAGVAAVLVAVSSWQIYWSQNARFYTFAEVVALFGVGLCLRGLFQRVPWKAPLGVLVIAAGALFHLQAAMLAMAFVLAPWCLVSLRRPLEREGRRGALLMLALMVMLGLVSAPWVLETWETYRSNKPIDTSVAGLLSSVAHFVQATGFYVTPWLGIAFLIGAVGAWRARDRFFMLLVLVVLLGTSAAVVASFYARVTAQYVFVLQPLIALVAAWPLQIIVDRHQRVVAWGYAALLIVPTLASSGLYFLVRHGERPRWREAYHYVWSQREPEDLVMGMMASVGEYYLNPGATDLRHPRQVAWFDTHHANVPAQWTVHGRRTWLVIRPEILEEFDAVDRSAARAFLREECRLMRRFPVEVEGRPLSVEVYLRDGS